MNQIHPTAVIGPRVRLGSTNVIGPFAVLIGDVELGSGNWVGAHVVIGAPPEVRSFDHGADPVDPGGAGVVVGDGNVLREGVQVHSGWHEPTRVGSRAFIMNQSYVAHDAEVGDDVTLASGVRLGGHVRLGRGANLGLGTTVHQRAVVGAFAMIGMSSVVTRDVAPFVKAFGNPCRAKGWNEAGMSRAGFSEADIAWLSDPDGEAPERVLAERAWFEGARA